MLGFKRSNRVGQSVLLFFLIMLHSVASAVSPPIGEVRLLFDMGPPENVEHSLRIRTSDNRAWFSGNSSPVYPDDVWVIAPAGGGAFTIQHRSTGLYLDKQINDNTQGMYIRGVNGPGGTNQFWLFEDVGNGFVIRNAENNYAMVLRGDKSGIEVRTDQPPFTVRVIPLDPDIHPTPPNQPSRMALPAAPENRDFHCSTSSAARLAGYYGWNPVEVFHYLNSNLGTVAPVGQALRFGPSPDELANLCNDCLQGANARYKNYAVRNDITERLDSRKPVICLIRVDYRPGYGPPPHYLGMKGPALHYVVANGYDENNLYYYDTDGTTDERVISWGDFDNEWGWKVGDGLIKAALTAAGVKTRSIVWFDR